MKKILFFISSLLIGILLFFLVIRVVGWQEIKRSFLVFTGFQGVIIFTLTLLMLVVSTLRWNEILKNRDINISFKNLFMLYLANFAFLCFFPMMVFGGEFFRSYVLKRKYSVPLIKGLATILVDRTLDLIINMIVVFSGVFLFLFKINHFSKILAVGWVSLFVFLAFLISIFYVRIFRKGGMLVPIARFLEKRNSGAQVLQLKEEVLNTFKFKKESLLKTLGWSVLRCGVAVFRIWILVFFLGKTMAIGSAFSVLSFTCLTALIPVPFIIGTHEAIQAFVFEKLGLGAGMGTAFTMIIRGTEILVALIGIFILLHLGTALLREIISDKLRKFF